MGDFALVTEGPTDHAVLENILRGFFSEQPRPLIIVREHPDPVSDQPEGWTTLMAYLRDKKFKAAFQFNEYLVVQVDTDVSEEKGFDVPKQNNAGPLSLEALVEAVKARLMSEIGTQDWITYGTKFIFAIAVGEIECWVLPLWEDQDAKAGKTAGCLKALGAALRRDKHSWMQKGHKHFDDYLFASKQYLKRTILMQRGVKNPSLRIFLDDLNHRNINLPTDN